MKILGNPFRVGVVSRYYTRDQRPVVDVRVSDGGVYFGAPLRLLGQGSLFPVSVGARVHLYFPQGGSDLPYVVGVDPVRGALPATSDAAGAGEDYAPSQQDLVLTHEGRTVSLSASGVTVDAGDASVRVQLASGQVFRVSVDGAASDKALKGQAFIDALFTLLNDYHTRVLALEAAVAALTSDAFVPVVTALPPVVKLQCEGAKAPHVLL
jgi:hypothetical protein